MLIHEMFKAPPLQAWLTLERHVNDGSPSGYEHAGLPQAYRPRGGHSTFPMPCVRCAAAAYTLLGSGHLPDALGAGPIIPVHPAVLPRYQPVDIARTLEVIPTSSARTVVLAEPEGPPAGCLKLHYPELLGRFPRPLDARRVVAALDVHSDLTARAQELPRFMGEPTGLLWRPRIRDREDAVGCIVRSLPDELSVDRGARLVPAFSLFSLDQRNPGHPPLLHQLVAESDAPSEVLWRDFLLPVVRAWGRLVQVLGHLVEWNAQNVLFLLHPRERPQLIFRDLQGTYRDLAVRPSGLPKVAPGGYKTLATEDVEAARRQRSYLFDFKLGQYLLRPLIDSVARLCNPVTDLRGRVREVMHGEVMPALPRDYFPKGGVWYAQAAGVRPKGPGYFVSRLGPEFR